MPINDIWEYWDPDAWDSDAWGEASPVPGNPHLITLGIGTPSDIAHLLLLGLNPVEAPPVSPTVSLAAFLAATAREEIILCELEPGYALSGFTAVGGATPNTYSIAQPRFVQTAQVKGGMYTKTIRVAQDGVPLTQRASIALVDANAGSWYWDDTAGVLYVRSSSGVPDSFTMIATRRLYLATAPVVLNQTAGDPSTGLYYLPWLMSDLPQVRQQVEDILSGITKIPSGSMSALNGHAAWYTLVAADGSWNWKYSLARFYFGGRYGDVDMDREDYAPIATMMIEDVAPTETTCTFSLQPLRRLSDLELPITPIFESAYPNLGDGVRGTKKWIGYGRATIRPDLTDTVTDQGIYTIADAAYQTLFAVNHVWAIEKATGIWTQLTETSEYTKNLTDCTVTIVSPSYPIEDYEIAVDASGKPDGSGSYLKKYGEILDDILKTFIGVAPADIDMTAFADVALDADAEMAVWVKQTRSLASIFASAEPEQPSMGRSVMGTVQQTATGKWTARIWDPSLDSITTTLRKEDLARFNPKPQLKTVYSAVRVYYGYDHAREEWSLVEVTDPRVQYTTGSRDRLDVFTFLVEENNARTIAQRYMVLAGAVTVEAEFEERGALLAQMNAGDKVYVTYSPAPTVTGAYESKPFEILNLTVRYAPKVTVTGVLGDLRGLGGRIGRWMDTSAPDWASASTPARQESGFWSDSNGLVDPGDPASAERSIWW